MFEKNNSTSIKDLLVTRITDEGKYARDVVEKVVNFQGEDMNKAFHEFTQVEISGLGLLFVAKGKVKTRISRYENYLRENEVEQAKKERLEGLLVELKRKQCLLNT